MTKFPLSKILSQPLKSHVISRTKKRATYFFFFTLFSEKKTCPF